MGKIKHHIGAIGGGINLSQSKTPHDADIKYDPINDRADSLSPFHLFTPKNNKKLPGLSDKKKTRIDKRDQRRADRKERVDAGYGTDVGNYLRGFGSKQSEEQSSMVGSTQSQEQSYQSRMANIDQAYTKAKTKANEYIDWDSFKKAKQKNPEVEFKDLTMNPLPDLGIGSMKGTPLEQSAKGSDSSYGIDGYVTNRKDLKQARKKYKIKHLSKEHKNLKDTYDMGQKVNEKKLFRVEDKLERKSRRYEKQYGETAFDSPASLVSSTTPKKSIKKQIGKAARAVEAKAPGVVQKYFNTLRKKQ